MNEKMREAFAQLIDKSQNDFLLLNNDLNGTDLANLGYEEFDADNNRLAPKSIFAFEFTKMNNIVFGSELPLPYLRSRYNMASSCNLSLHEVARGRREIFRLCPMDWSSLVGITVSSHKTSVNGQNLLYVKHDTMPTGRPVADRYIEISYIKEVKRNLKFAFMIEYMKLQKQTTGFYRLPRDKPRNWTLDEWSWLDNSDITLDQWTSALNRDTYCHIFDYINMQLDSIKKFKDDMRLSDHRF